MKPRTFNPAFTRTVLSHYAQPPGGHARGAGMALRITLRGPLATRSLVEFPEICCRPGPAPRRSIAAGQGHVRDNVTATGICFSCVTNWLHLSDISEGRDARPARLPGEVTERNLYATVQRQPVRAFAAGPGRDWLPFTDTNVIFAGWPGGPHPGRPGQARRPPDPAGSLARTDGPGHRGGCREHGHAEPGTAGDGLARPGGRPRKPRKCAPEGRRRT